jgi:NAD-dependent dihydropyrimidine dehydrogenase PreA subunit
MYQHRYLSGVATLRYDSEKCTGCGRCIEVCPHGVFRMDQKRAAVTNADFCMECGACKKNCRFGAIEVREGVGCAGAIALGKLKGTAPTCG